MKIHSFWSCQDCGKKFAEWVYMPSEKESLWLLCNDCVPKGCSCNEPDEQDLPCCEWWPITKEDIKSNPDGFKEE